MTDVLPNPSPTDNIPLTTHVDDDLAKARDSLRLIDEGIRTLTNGRTEFGPAAPNGPAGQQQGYKRFAQQNFRQSTGDNSSAPNFSLKRRFVSTDDDQQQQQRPSVFKRINMRGVPVGDFDDRRNAVRENGGIFLWEKSQIIDYLIILYIDFDEDVDFNQPKPAVASSVFVTTKEVKSRDTAIAEMKESEKGANKTRNKRMFGLLLGTLQRFKQEEDVKHSRYNLHIIV